MNSNTTHISLRSATLRALNEFGLSILDNPKRFLGYLLDYLDSDDGQTRVLEINCDSEFLAPYAEAARVGTKEAIEMSAAAAQAAYYVAYQEYSEEISETTKIWEDYVNQLSRNATIEIYV